MPKAPANDNRRIQTYADFWPYYLSEHRDATSRRLHFVGTGLTLPFFAAAALSLNPAWLLAAAGAGYAFAWAGHFFFERNRPATFKYPFWSLASDYRMFWLWLRGRLGAELRRAGAV